MDDPPYPLPFRTAVRDGEEWAGWFERLAWQHQVGPGQLVNTIGLAEPGAREMANYGVGLSSRQRRRLAAATGMPPDAWDASLISSLHGVAAELGGYDPERRSTRATVFTHNTWLVGKARWCAECLAEDGTWRLLWRSALAFGCADHSVVLADQCPGCGHAVGLAERRRVTEPVPPAGCHRCGTDLAAAPVVRFGRYPKMKAAARAVRAAVTDGTATVFGSPVGALEYLNGLRMLVRVIEAAPDAVGVGGYLFPDEVARHAPASREEAFASIPVPLRAAALVTVAHDLTTLARTDFEDRAAVWWPAVSAGRDAAKALLRRGLPSPVTEALRRALDRSDFRPEDSDEQPGP